MDCDLVCSLAWMGNESGPVIRPASMEKNVTDSGRADGCTMMRGELIDAADDFGKLAEQRFQFLDAWRAGLRPFQIQDW